MRRAIVAALIVVCSTARADDRDRAAQFFRAGEQAYRAQSFAAAAADFEEAYKALPLPEIAFSAAQAYRHQYRVESKPEYVTRAIKLYRAYLDKVKTGGRVQDASEALEDMQRELDVLIKRGEHVGADIAAERTQLNVSVFLGPPPRTIGMMREIEDKEPAPAGQVLVSIDGNLAEPFAPVGVSPGPHSIHVEAPGYFSKDQDAVAAGGESTPVNIVLQPKPGRLAVTTEAGAAIYVDGQQIATAPHAAVELAPGAHVVAVTQRGREPATRQLTVANDQAIRIDLPLVATSRRRAVPWVLGGAGVAAVASIGTGIAAYVEQRDALAVLDRANSPGNVDPSQVAAYDTDRSRRDALVTAAAVTGGATVLAAIVGLALYQFDEPVVPIATLNGAGAVVTGRF
jgi:hypothetical protein